MSITSDVGTVTLTGDTSVPASGRSGRRRRPTARSPAWSSVETADAAEATVALDKPITNGLTYNFTFTFEQAGETTVAGADLGG